MKRGLDEFLKTTGDATTAPYTTTYQSSNRVNDREYASITEAMSNNDILGAVTLYLNAHGNIRLSDNEITFLNTVSAYDVLKYGSKKLTLPTECTENTINAFLYVLQHTSAGLSEIYPNLTEEKHVIHALNNASRFADELMIKGNSKITTEIVEAVANVISKHTNLKRIYAYGYMNGSLSHITEAMKKNTTLKTLHIEREPPINETKDKEKPSLNPDELIAFAKMLETNTTLTDLSFKGANIPDDVAKAFANMLEINNHLNKLSLYGCRISSDGLAFFATVLDKKEDLHSLSFLNLSGNCLIGAEELIKVKRKHPSLGLYVDFCGGSGTCVQPNYWELPKPPVRQKPQ